MKPLEPKAMNTHHTPGPWIVAKRPVGKRQTTVVLDANRNEVCEAYDSAALISAAPELLAALRGLTAVVESYEYGRPWPGRPHAQMDEARAAIAKARGEDQ